MLARVNLTESYLRTLEREEDGYRIQDGAFIATPMVDLHGEIINVIQRTPGLYQWSSARWNWKQEWLDFDLTLKEVKPYAR